MNNDNKYSSHDHSGHSEHNHSGHSGHDHHHHGSFKELFLKSLLLGIIKLIILSMASVSIRILVVIKYLQLSLRSAIIKETV